MDQTQQTVSQVDRALERTICKFPPSEQPAVFTDIHLKVNQDSGELLSFNDDGEELNRAVVSAWIDNKDEHFFSEVGAFLRRRLQTMGKRVDAMGISKPFSFVLEDDDKECTSELYVVDDDTIIIGENLMEGLSDELDKFLDELLKE